MSISICSLKKKFTRNKKKSMEKKREGETKHITEENDDVWWKKSVYP